MPMPEPRKTPEGIYPNPNPITNLDNKLATENPKWNDDDGMTHAIMSKQDEKDELKQIHAGTFTNKKKGLDEIRDPKEKVRNIVELVDNIDSIAEKAKDIKLTKNEFIDCLR